MSPALSPPQVEAQELAAKKGKEKRKKAKDKQARHKYGYAQEAALANGMQGVDATAAVADDSGMTALQRSRSSSPSKAQHRQQQQQQHQPPGSTQPASNHQQQQQGGTGGTTISLSDPAASFVLVATQEFLRVYPITHAVAGDRTTAKKVQLQGVLQFASAFVAGGAPALVCLLELEGEVHLQVRVNASRVVGTHTHSHAGTTPG